MIEGDIDFQFPTSYATLKFDDTSFYRNHFNKLPYAKGVDFLIINCDEIIFLEVKDFYGEEGHCRWKIRPDKHKYGTNNERLDSVDIEVAEKVAMTLACLAGAVTKRNLQTPLENAEKVISMLLRHKIPAVRVILFLEGNFASSSKTSKMIMKDLQVSIQKKLSWLECKVIVENLSTQMGKYFHAERKTPLKRKV